MTQSIFVGSGIILVLNRDVLPEDVENNVSWVKAEFPTNLYTWYDYDDEPNVDLYLVGLFMNGVSHVTGVSRYQPAGEFFSGHQKLLVMVDNKWTSNYVNQYGVFPSNLVKQLESASQVPLSPQISLESYEIYHSEGLSMYLLNLHS